MGEVTVTVTLTDGAITGCVIEGPDETEGIGSVVLENAPDEIVSANKGSIDVVAGATITSNAVNEALPQLWLLPAWTLPTSPGSAAEGQTAEDKVHRHRRGGRGRRRRRYDRRHHRRPGRPERGRSGEPGQVGGNSVRATGGLNATKTPAPVRERVQ